MESSSPPPTSSLTSSQRRALPRPSIFDVHAAAQLDEAVYPAARHLCQVLCDHWPESHVLRTLCRWFDETFLALSCAVHWHSLASFGGSVAECFYGLCRLSSASAPSSSRHLALTRRGFLLSLLSLSVWPYLRRYLCRHVLDRQLDEIPPDGAAPDRSAWRTRLLRHFRRLLTVVYTVANLVKFYFTVAFTLGHSGYHSLLAAVLQVQLRVNPGLSDDYVTNNGNVASKCGWVLARAARSCAMLVQLAHWYHQLASSTTTHLPPSISSLSTISDLSSHAPPPSPPPSCLPLLRQRQVDRGGKLGVCGVCRLSLAQADSVGVLSVSGCVFCFTCVMAHVMTYGRCPVTGWPACTEQVYRLHLSSPPHANSDAPPSS